MLLKSLVLTGYAAYAVTAAITGLAQSLAGDSRGETPNWASQIAGNTGGGSSFDDIDLVSAKSGHQRIVEVNVAGCDGGHLTMLGFGFKDLHNANAPIHHVTHGRQYKGQAVHTLTLKDGEYIKQVDATTWRQKFGRKRKLRLSWVKFTTTTDRVLDCGGYSGSDPGFTMNYPGHYLLYMKGTSGDAIDSLQGVFLSPSLY